MNKFSCWLFGILAILCAACSNEEMVTAGDSDQNNGNIKPGSTATVTLNLILPTFQTRAFSDGTKATHLQYAVYDVTNGNPIKLENFTNTEEEIHGEKKIPFQLVTGNTYNFIFWASAPSEVDFISPYSVVFGDNGATLSVNYLKEDKTPNIFSNEERLDAFYVCLDNVTVTGDKEIEAELNRPFAQINLLTNDYEAAELAQYIPTLSKAAIRNLSDKMDLMTGKVSGKEEVIFDFNTINRTGDFEPTELKNYEFLNMIYVLVGESQLVELNYKWKQKNDIKESDWSVNSVPVKPNHRTNIYGSLLTNPVNVNIQIGPTYIEPDLP